MLRWCSILRVGLATALVCLLGTASPVLAASGDHPKLDKALNARAGQGGKSRVIVVVRPGWDASRDVARLGGRLGRRLNLISGQVVELPNGYLRRLADFPEVVSVHLDRPTGGEMNRAAVTVGARAVQQYMGFDGSGVSVAVIDSGITSWHDDLSYPNSSLWYKSPWNQRVATFVDFVQGRLTPYDDNGHGTHVSGIIAGNGYDSRGAHAGVAPGARIVSLKVLDGRGRGVISNVIAAVEYAIANKTAYNIRVINMSVGAAVTESFNTDPLTLATKRAVDEGIVVVAAAGNLGKNALGQEQYGAITAPGNAPWVLTVGASSHQGTVQRYDDVVASYSSRGPSAVDFQAKPDLVAPGTGIVSLSDPNSTFYISKASYLVSGSVYVGYKPYLSLTGTSMASPVVAGTVALMMQANPNLTPNLVKAILQYTAQESAGYDALTQGAGFLNSKGAVTLANFFAHAAAGQTYPTGSLWSRKVLWGSHRVSGGVLKPNGTAWDTDVVWGAAFDADGDNIVWGTLCRDQCDNIVWGTLEQEADNIVWGTASDAADNIVWGTFRDADDNIVWGTLADVDNIVWGTDCGGRDCDNIVWGTTRESLDDNIVWGTATIGDNIVWGTVGDVDNIVWGTAAEEDNLTWGNSGEETPLFDDPNAEPAVFDGSIFDNLFLTEPIEVAVSASSEAMSTTTSTTSSVEGGL